MHHSEGNAFPNPVKSINGNKAPPDMPPEYLNKFMNRRLRFLV